MSEAGGSVGWQQLREFRGVDVSRSYVLSWRLDRDTLMLDADVELRPEHPFYEPPRRRGKACMRSAVIEFPCCASVKLDGGSASDAPPQVVGRLASGGIRDLTRRDGGPYVISGEFGVVEIDAERPILRLRDN